MKAEKIIKLREKHGATQSQLAEFLGINQASVSRLERGQAKPSGPVERLLRQLEKGEIQWQIK